MQIEQMKELILAAIEQMKGRDVRVLDVRGLTDITDYMVVASGTSDRHIRSIAAHVVEDLKKRGCRPLGSEGESAGEWVLIDFGDVVVHIMSAASREFYDLEKLWGEDIKALIAAQRDAAGE